MVSFVLGIVGVVWLCLLASEGASARWWGMLWSRVPCALCGVDIRCWHVRLERLIPGRGGRKPVPIYVCSVCDGKRDDYPPGTRHLPEYGACEDCGRTLPRPSLKGLMEKDDDYDSIALLCRSRCLPEHIRAKRERTTP